jgi:hypothetical protein
MTCAKKFIELIQHREANVSIEASAARGMGKGTVEAARTFLCGLRLAGFATRSEAAFLQRLDAETLALQKRLPQKSWGAARKFLNIFLRGALYNRFLCEHFGLASLEPFLEVPLDKSVATALRKRDHRSSLPRWNTIVRLEKEASDKYQTFARRVAERKKLARVHLDLWYWRAKSQDEL